MRKAKNPIVVYASQWDEGTIRHDLRAGLISAHDSGHEDVRIALSTAGMKRLASSVRENRDLELLPGWDVETGQPEKITVCHHPRTGEPVPVDHDPKLPGNRLEIRG